MIKKLFSLIWNCIKSPFKKYHWHELYLYLTKGYTSNDYTDLDLYLLDVIATMGFDLANHINWCYRKDDADIDVLSYAEEAKAVLDLAEKARILYVDMLNEVFTPQEQEKHRKEFLKLLSTMFFRLWV